MHGQKRRRRRTLSGGFEIDGFTILWELLSEPQWTTERGAKGTCLSVWKEGGGHRELVLQYPFEQPGRAPQFPQRPALPTKTIEEDVRRAITAGWDPLSRGKAFVFLVPEIEAKISV